MKNNRAQGQIIALFAGGMFAIIALVALVIDGGSVFAQQRVAQNGADGTATAGTLVVAQALAGASRTDGDVLAAVTSAASSNGLENATAIYTDDLGVPLAPPQVVGANPTASVPGAARGVRASGSRAATLTFGRWILGQDTLQASAEATVVAGALATNCPPDSGCALLPVTFPITTLICDGKGIFTGIGGPGDIWQEIPVDLRTPANEAIIPLCKIDSGAVGWLDLTPGQNLSSEIADGPGGTFPIPAWIQTQPGNVNAVEDEINDNYADSIIVVPLFDGTCLVDPGDASSAETCPQDKRGVDTSPAGNNTWYHIPYFVSFWLDRAYVSANNVDSCATDPGEPKIDPSSPGFLGCFKGWFVQYIVEGPIRPGGTITPSTVIAIQLIK